MKNLDMLQRSFAKFERDTHPDGARPVAPIVAPSQDCNLLVVNGQAEEAEALVRMVSALGYKASSCRTSTEAVRIVAGDRSIGIVIADAACRPLDGLWIARELSLRFALIRAVAVVVCAREADAAASLAALRANVSDIVTGEPTLEKVSASLRRAFGRWSEQAHLLRMNSLVDMGRTGRRADNDYNDSADGPSDALKVARCFAKIRRTRSKFFEPWVLASPTWDILLELSLAALQSEVVSVSSICALTEFPTSTALRHVRLLEKAGMITRKVDDCDRRRALLRIEPDALATMQRYFDASKPAMA